jgi:curved DNA-binding protein CbpA
MSNYTVNFYEVLGVESNASMKEIKKQYSKLIIKYHPDKIKHHSDKIKDKFESNLFELIQKAYETIGNDEKRQEYDFFLKNIQSVKSSDWYSLKTNYDKYKELDEIKPKNKNSVQIEFDKVFKDFDLKHGIERNKSNDKVDKFDKEEITNRLDDLVLQREQDEIEFSQNKIFKEDQNFDVAKFNAAYDIYKTTNDKQIIKHANVMAYNFDGGNNSNFNDLNVYDKTFNEDNDFEGNNLYSNIHVGKTNRLDKDKVKNIKPVDYTFTHNKLENNYEDKIKERLEERNHDTQKFDNMKYQDFNNEDKVFQFSHDVGITENMLDWSDNTNNNEDLLKACKKLIESEKN